MGEKIFGEIQKTEELNELANNLRKSKELDEIRLLCKENGISDDVAEDFVQGKRLILAEAGYLEDRKAAGKIQEGVSTTGEVIKEDVAENAKEKLKKELKDAKAKGFADPIISHLLKRCDEDKKLAQDIMQEHKTWKKCFDYIYALARNQKKENAACAAVPADVVFGWVEEYYRKDDAAEEKKKAEQKAAQQTKQKPATAEKKADAKQESKGPEPKKLEKSHEPKANKKGLNGQLSLFDILGGAEG